MGDVVDLLCNTADARKIKIYRDIDDLNTSESIEKFMRDIGAGDRIFIVLSDKYLRSPYCMRELYETWAHCALDTETLRQRTRVFAQPCAGLGSRQEVRAKISEIVDYWEAEYRDLDKRISSDPRKVSKADIADYQMIQIVIPCIAEILRTFSDVVRATKPEDFVDHALDGCVSRAE
ncbi:MAG: hypothetical protein AAFW82_05940 [Pseudomonadota bacterium]